MFNYSIIIPHKNSPDLLERCLKSIPQRDDAEIIIVDDNSDPTIVDFAAFPGIDRFQTRCLFDKEGKGAGAARNIGLKYATGKWVYFMDADDMLSPEANVFFDKYASDVATDMVFLNAMAFDENGDLFSISLNRYIRNYLHNRKFALDVLRYGFWAPWNHLIKRELFNKYKIQFNTTKVGNDKMGIILASFHAKSFAVEPNIIYYYFTPTYGSQTKKLYNFSSYLEIANQEFVIRGIYKEAKYIFQLPICRICKNAKWNKTPEVQEIFKRNKFNLFSDIFTIIRFCYAKILRII